MLPTMTMMPTTMLMTANTTRCTPDRSKDTASQLSNRTSLMQSTAELASTVDNNFEMMIPMPPPATTTSLTPLSESRISDSDMTDQITYNSENTVHWLSNSFALVSKAIDCLAIEIVNLSDSILAATSKSIVGPPLPLTFNSQPHRPQPQPLYPRSYQLLDMRTRSYQAPNPITKCQPNTHQQNPHPKQTHQHHHNHTKHRHFLCPSLPIPHCHSSKCLPVPANINPPSITDT